MSLQENETVIYCHGSRALDYVQNPFMRWPSLFTQQVTVFLKSNLHAIQVIMSQVCLQSYVSTVGLNIA